MELPKNLFQILQKWLYLTLAGIAVIAFLSALLVDPPQQDTSANVGVGFYAALIAMCVAACALLNSAYEPEKQRIIEIVMAVGICASAYLWISAEAGLHPTNPELPLSLLAMFLVIGTITLAVPLISYFRGKGDDGGNSE